MKTCLPLVQRHHQKQLKTKTFKSKSDELIEPLIFTLAITIVACKG